MTHAGKRVFLETKTWYPCTTLMRDQKASPPLKTVLQAMDHSQGRGNEIHSKHRLLVCCCQWIIVQWSCRKQPFLKLLIIPGYGRKRWKPSPRWSSKEFMSIEILIITYKVVGQTFVPLRYGRCKKSPFLIFSEAWTDIRLSGGPTAGCHAWLFRVVATIWLLMFINV